MNTITEIVFGLFCRKESSMKRISRLFVYGLILVSCFVGMEVFAQEPPDQPIRPVQRMLMQRAQRANPVARLNNALRQAGAPLLSDNQVEQLRSFFQEFRNANEPPDEGDAQQTVRNEFNNAILYGDPDVGAVVKAQADVQEARLMARMTLARNVIEMLKAGNENGEQFDPLMNWMGSSGVVQLVMSLSSAPIRELRPQ
jgi:hypothetical protein